MPDETKKDEATPEETKTEEAQPGEAKKDEAKPEEAKSGEEKPEDVPFVTAAEKFELDDGRGAPTPGLSYSARLRDVPGSPVPGASYNHVWGPGQAAADPAAAGLDTGSVPRSMAENRGVTRADGTTAAAVPDSEHEQAPGPNGSTTEPKPAA